MDTEIFHKAKEFLKTKGFVRMDPESIPGQPYCFFLKVEGSRLYPIYQLHINDLLTKRKIVMYRIREYFFGEMSGTPIYYGRSLDDVYGLNFVQTYYWR